MTTDHEATLSSADAATPHRAYALLTKADIRRFVDRLIDLIHRNHPVPATADAAESGLRVAAETWDRMPAPQLAATATAHLRQQDGHFAVLWQPPGREGLPDHRTGTDLWHGTAPGFTVAPASEPGGTSLRLQFTVLLPPDMRTPGGRTTGAAVMDAIRQATRYRRLTLDLRGVPGHSPELVLLVLALLTGPVPVHALTVHGSGGASRQEHTPDVDPSAVFHGHVGVLINRRTASAAESLAYVLQSLRRADVAGEPSAGLAHRVGTYPFDDDSGFMATIPSAVPVDPRTGSNWAGCGVRPGPAPGAKEREVEGCP